MLTTYIHFDVLSPEIFERQFHAESLDVRTSLMALVNNMVSDYQGRSYLLQSEQIVESLVEKMR